jgi:uncharacterized DUF497 family protein
MDGFEWDPIKAATNLKDHEVDFADAAVALSDLLAMTIEDPDAEGEERFITVSMDALGRILITVVYLRWSQDSHHLVSQSEPR